MIEFRLLGAVEIRAGDRPVGALQPRQRHVLAALLVDANRPVAWPALIDRIWGRRPPADARTTARAHLSRIRGVLRDAAQPSGSAQLLRGAGGYELRADLDHIDLHRMRRLAGQARHPSGTAGQRVTLLREAVGLWRGEPLAGLTGEWSDRMRASWTQEHLGIVAAWADAEIEVGNAAGVIGRLADLTGENPLVESLAVAQLRALRAVGRTAEAVARYAWMRDRLVADLGVEPGAELQRVHRSLLRGTSPAPGPAQRFHVPLGAASGKPGAALLTRPAAGPARDRLTRLRADVPDRISSIKATADEVRTQVEGLLDLIEDAVTARVLAGEPEETAEVQKAHAGELKTARAAVQDTLSVLAEAVVAVTDL